MTYKERVAKFNKFAEEHPEYQFQFDGEKTIVYIPAEHPWEFSKTLGYMSKDEDFIRI